MNEGGYVNYLGSTSNQVHYYGHDDPRQILEIGAIYRVSKIEVNNWYTDISLVGINGRFNSVCFEETSPSPPIASAVNIQSAQKKYFSVISKKKPKGR